MLASSDEPCQAASMEKRICPIWDLKKILPRRDMDKKNIECMGKVG